MVNHNDVDASIVSAKLINTAKNEFKVFYGHTSHGSQITSGMSSMNQEPYTYSKSGANGSLK